MSAIIIIATINNKRVVREKGEKEASREGEKEAKKEEEGEQF